jgi:hypothetical protein
MLKCMQPEMDKQPVPSVTANDVERIVRRDFPGEHFAAAMDILNEYGSAEWHRESPRVQLAVLKLAGGNLKDLRLHIETAKCDYRDVLSPAEYPRYTGRGFGEMRRLPLEERERIIESDWNQYETWLNQRTD